VKQGLLVKFKRERFCLQIIDMPLKAIVPVPEYHGIYTKPLKTNIFIELIELLKFKLKNCSGEAKNNL
jgi:hypothetical protein